MLKKNKNENPTQVKAYSIVLAGKGVNLCGKERWNKEQGLTLGRVVSLLTGY